MSLRRVLFPCLLPAACCLMLVGCSGPVKPEVIAANIEDQAAYVELTLPAVEAYCDSLAAAGYEARAAQLRVDVRTLASSITQECAVMAEAYRSTNQAITAARAALKAAEAILESYAKKEQTNESASQPSN